MICKSCGHLLNGTDRFCPNCGAKVMVEIPQTGSASPAFSGGENGAQGVMRQTEGRTNPPGQSDKPKRHFQIEEIDWNLDGYPTEKKPTTDEVDFNWESVIDEHGKTQRKREENTEALNKIRPEASEVKPAEVKEEPAQEPLKASAQDIEEVIFGTKDRHGNISDTMRFDDAEDLSKTTKMDKFYTYNKKNEEFQELLDKEYNRLKDQIDYRAEEEEETEAASSTTGAAFEMPTFESLKPEAAVEAAADIAPAVPAAGVGAAFEMPNFEAPENSFADLQAQFEDVQKEQSEAPAFELPEREEEAVAPAFEMPAFQAEEAPIEDFAAASFEAAEAEFSAPQTDAFEAPQTEAFETPQTEAFETPQTEMFAPVFEETQNAFAAQQEEAPVEIPGFMQQNLEEAPQEAFAPVFEDTQNAFAAENTEFTPAFELPAQDAAEPEFVGVELASTPETVENFQQEAAAQAQNAFEAPAFEAPVFETPAQSAFEAPVFETPAQSAFEAPSFEAPAQSAFEAPSFEAPAQNTYETPAQDAFVPQQAAPEFDIPVAESFGQRTSEPVAEAQDAFTAPVFQNPVQDTFSVAEGPVSDNAASIEQMIKDDTANSPVDSKITFQDVFKDELEAEKAEKAKTPKKHTGLKILAIILCVLILLEIIVICIKYMAPDSAAAIKLQDLFNGVYNGLSGLLGG